jgi:predicted DsbA family dithiol-disulfide isomerase
LLVDSMTSFPPTPLRIDFVSDVACPWCAVGLASLEMALGQLGWENSAQVHMQPFELNPGMGPEGVDAAQYLSRKYGMTAEQLAAARANLRARGAEVGFTFGERSRIWNTFDAHRLIHWAGQDMHPPGTQLALKRALLRSYHGESKNPSDPNVLADAALEAGLDRNAAQEVIQSDAFADAVREAEAFWQSAGINAVPAVVINRQHLIAGGQPPQVFVSALRQVAADANPQASYSGSSTA